VLGVGVAPPPVDGDGCDAPHATSDARKTSERRTRMTLERITAPRAYTRREPR
jgi:hypothetical protein